MKGYYNKAKFEDLRVYSASHIEKIADNSRAENWKIDKESLLDLLSESEKSEFGEETGCGDDWTTCKHEGCDDNTCGNLVVCPSDLCP